MKMNMLIILSIFFLGTSALFASNFDWRLKADRSEGIEGETLLPQSGHSVVTSNKVLKCWSSCDSVCEGDPNYDACYLPCFNRCIAND
jgi:hypothetical protein